MNAGAFFVEFVSYCLTIICLPFQDLLFFHPSAYGNVNVADETASPEKVMLTGPGAIRRM